MTKPACVCSPTFAQAESEWHTKVRCSGSIGLNVIPRELSCILLSCMSDGVICHPQILDGGLWKGLLAQACLYTEIWARLAWQPIQTTIHCSQHFHLIWIQGSINVTTTRDIYRPNTFGEIFHAHVNGLVWRLLVPSTGKTRLPVHATSDMGIYASAETTQIETTDGWPLPLKQYHQHEHPSQQPVDLSEDLEEK